jgi:hypothetical protein
MTEFQQNCFVKLIVCRHTIVKLRIIYKTKNRRNSFIPAVYNAA